MFVTLEYPGFDARNDVQEASFIMREVKTEEEAFAEMRRFLKVNKIISDTTYVAMVPEKKERNRIIPAHKEIGMDLRNEELMDYDNDDEIVSTTFAIYYGSVPSAPRETIQMAKKDEMIKGCLRRYLNAIKKEREGN